MNDNDVSISIYIVHCWRNFWKLEKNSPKAEDRREYCVRDKGGRNATAIIKT